MRSSIFCILLCRCLAAQNAADIEGVVRDVGTHHPLPGVHINLWAGGVDSWGAISDKDGRFSIARIAPDVYQLSAQQNGYVRVPAKDETANFDAEVTLNPGQNLTGFVIEMTPLAAIAGKVIDEFGDPVQNAHLEAIPADTRKPRAIFGMSSDTDERGQYRMTGLPGSYLIKVSNTRAFEFIEAGARSEGTSSYGVTWYPSAVNQVQAHAVETAPGRNTTGIDIRTAQALSLNIGGVVNGRGDHPVPVMLRLISEDNNETIITQAGPDGNFRVSGLAPGRYWVAASDNTGTLRAPRVEVSLQTADETRLVLELAKSAELSGILKIESAQQGATLPDHLTVQLQPIGPDVQPKGGDVDHDGAFHMEEVFPGSFKVLIAGLPENAYVKSVALDDAESQSNRLDLTQDIGSGRAMVVVDLNGAQIEGTVTDGEGKPIDSPRPFVALVTQPEEAGGDTIRAEAEGRFRFPGVRPGKYRLVAIDSRQQIGDHAAFIKAFAEATEFEVREGDRVEQNVRVAVAETSDAKP